MKTLRVIPLPGVLSGQLHQVFHWQILVGLAVHATFDYWKPCYRSYWFLLDTWRPLSTDGTNTV